MDDVSLMAARRVNTFFDDTIIGESLLECASRMLF